MMKKCITILQRYRIILSYKSSIHSHNLQNTFFSHSANYFDKIREYSISIRI